MTGAREQAVQYTMTCLAARLQFMLPGIAFAKVSGLVSFVNSGFVSCIPLSVPEVATLLLALELLTVFHL